MEIFSLIFPVYNEEEALPALFEELSQPFFESAELIFVDDASPDGTLRWLRKKQKEDARLLIVHHKRRLGQHVALLTGLAQAGQRLVALADGDAQWKLDVLPEMLESLSEADIVVSYRKARESPFRRFASHLFNAMVVRGLFHLPVRDIGSPVKAFSRSQAEAILKAGGFFRFLPEMRSLRIEEVELFSQPIREKRESRYSLFALLSLFKKALFPPFLQPASGEEVVVFQKGVPQAIGKGGGKK